MAQFFFFSWFRSKELKNVVMSIITQSLQQSSPKIFQQSNLALQTYLPDLFYAAQFQIDTKNASNKFVYRFMRQHMCTRSWFF